MDTLQCFELAKRNVQEIITEAELESKCQQVASNPGSLKAYIGFEPSGKVHLGWKITANKIADLCNAGFETTILLADWHAKINDKLGGDLEVIRACGRYMEECFRLLGVPSSVKFLYASDYIGVPDYWATVIDVAKNTTLAKMRKSMDIMGRSESEVDRDVSKFLYPAMQVADIFYHNFDVVYGGIDQRHAHVLARDVAPKLIRSSPVAIHTPLLPSLRAEGRMDAAISKMSKSQPSSALLIDDGDEAIRKKINSAFCPPGDVDGNPVFALLRLIVFPEIEKRKQRGFEVRKQGAVRIFESVTALENQYRDGRVHPADLKASLAQFLISSLEPVRTALRASEERRQFEEMKMRISGPSGELG